MAESLSRKQQAEQKKLQANELYKQRQFAKAAELYSEAITLDPESDILYNNRAAARMSLKHFKGATADCMEAIRLNPSFVKAIVRAAKCQLILGNIFESQRLYREARLLSPESVLDSDISGVNMINNLVSLTNALIERADYKRAKESLNKLIALAVADMADESDVCNRWKLMKGEILCGLGDLNEAGAIASTIMRAERNNVDAMYLRGIVFYMQGEMAKALAHLQQVLTFDPDHTRARMHMKRIKALENAKNEGNTAFQAQQFNEAVRLYTHALTLDPTNTTVNTKLYSNRATAYAKLSDHINAVADCDKALELDPLYYKVLLRRADCLIKLEQYDEALQTFRQAEELEPKNSELKNAIRKTERLAQMAKRQDHYKTLGITRSASEREIKLAYRKLALEFHPDKTQGNVALEARFKMVNEAYSVLSDSQKRARHDSGIPDSDIYDDGGCSHANPNDFLNTFFNQQGAGGFGASYMYDQGDAFDMGSGTRDRGAKFRRGRN